MNEPQDNDIERDTETIDIFNSDLDSINPNVWFNKIESRLQYCLVKENANEGFKQYKMLVNHVEMLAISSRKMNETEYEQELEEEIKKADIKGDDLGVDMKKSMIKYKIILKNLLQRKNSDLNLSF